MAITMSDETVTLGITERSARVQIETPYGGVPVIEIFRETVKIANGEMVSKSDWTKVSRRAPDIMKETVTLHSGAVVSAAQIAEAIAVFGDKWAAEDSSKQVSATG